MKKFISYIFVLVFSCGCAHHSHEEANLTDTKESNIFITKDFKGNHWNNIYFSGQPDEKTFSQLKENGFETVINLREKKEGAYDESWEEGVVKREGINYYNIPFSMNDEVTDDYLDLVTSKVREHKKDGKVLVHCSSGNRVGIWVGAHFNKDHNLSSEKSLELAREMGMTSPGAETKLRAYLYKNKIK